MIATPLSPDGTDGHDQRAAAVDAHSCAPVVGRRRCREPQDSARPIRTDPLPEEGSRRRRSIEALQSGSRGQCAARHRSAPRSASRTRSNAWNSSAERSTPAAIDFDILTSSATRPCLRNTHRSHTSARSWMRCDDTITAAPCVRISLSWVDSQRVASGSRPSHGSSRRTSDTAARRVASTGSFRDRAAGAFLATGWRSAGDRILPPTPDPQPEPCVRRHVRRKRALPGEVPHRARPGASPLYFARRRPEQPGHDPQQ